VTITGIPFLQAVDAIVAGDEAGLRALLQAHPALVRERAPFAHQATLLHYVAANGVEVQRSPGNAPAVARILLEAGAEADALASVYGPEDTTMCLTVTSVHPYLAGVQASLVDVLVDHGAKVDGVAGDGGPLGCALLFGYRGAAERLALRGARVDNLITPGDWAARTLFATCWRRTRAWTVSCAGRTIGRAASRFRWRGTRTRARWH